MNKLSILPTLSKYKLEPLELACISIYAYTGVKLFAWSNTVGRESKSKNQSVLAFQWFRQERIQKYLFEHKIIDPESDNFKEEMIDSDLIKETDIHKNKGEKTEISSENIKELLEREYQKTTDPEKRTVLLIKIADFIGLKNNDQDDPLTPVIYLPERCQSCKFKQATKE